MPRVSKKKSKKKARYRRRHWRGITEPLFMSGFPERMEGMDGETPSIFQKQICTDFVKKHPEMLLAKNICGQWSNRNNF